MLRTRCTAARRMQRSCPRDERHASCPSASARRKKCTLGRPARPCFSRSAPCPHVRASRVLVCRDIGSGFATSKRKWCTTARALWNQGWYSLHTLRSAISSSSSGRRVDGAGARPSCSGPLPLVGVASAASNGSLRSRRAAAGKPAYSVKRPISGPKRKLIGQEAPHTSYCYRPRRLCAPRSRAQLHPGPSPEGGGGGGGWDSITEVLWSPGSCRSLLPVTPVSKLGASIQ